MLWAAMTPKQKFNFTLMANRKQIEVRKAIPIK